MRIVNAGSVGMPFVKTGADWLLIDDDVEFRHTSYDLNAAADRIRRSNYPLAKSFAANNVMNSISQAEALAKLSKL